MNDILTQEDMYWRQKARCKWHIEGERNTKYFHAMVVEKRRKNRVLQLKLGDGEWCSDEELLRNTARDFYKALYTKESCTMTDRAG